MPDDGPRALETDVPAADCVRRDELARAMVEMLDDEIRHLKMRVGILTARRDKIVRQFTLQNS